MEIRSPSRKVDCLHCGESFKSNLKRGKYQACCSPECASENAKTGAWVECVVCGTDHWKEKLRIERNKNNYCSLECRNVGKIEHLCGESWHGGVVIHSAGYVMDAVSRHKTKNKGHKTRLKYVGRHRLVVESFIGRKLSSNEAVLHVNQDKNDLRLDNLHIISMSGMWRMIGAGDWPVRSNLNEYRQSN